MTPLARWVLLTTLLGHATSVPARTLPLEDACVALCLAENAAANEDKVHVIPRRQFAEGRRGRGADRLFGHCFERPSHSTICTILFEALREYRGCDCELTKNLELPDRLYLSSSLLKDLSNDYTKISKLLESRLLSNEEEMVRRNLRKGEGSSRRRRNGPLTFDLSSSIMETDGQQRPNDALVSGTSDASSDSEPVDWDLWCMAQCDNGHGGSACECDIIPWGGRRSSRRAIERRDFLHRGTDWTTESIMFAGERRIYISFRF